MLTNLMFPIWFLSILLSAFGQKVGHLQPIGQSGRILPLEQMDGFPTPRVFIKDYVLKSRPLLMKNAVGNTPAFQLWTDEYLASKAPVGPEGYVSTEHGKKERRKDEEHFVHFREFLQIYNTSDIYLVDGVPKFLDHDIVMPGCLQCSTFFPNFAAALMWLSSGGTKSVLHLDTYENMNCLYRGSKRFLLINSTKYADIMNTLIDNDDRGFSYVDVESVDLDKYPMLSGMEFFEVTMHPSDCLYIPFSWVHQVNSDGSNLAVNVWWNEMSNATENVGDVISHCRDEMDMNLTLDKVRLSPVMESHRMYASQWLKAIAKEMMQFLQAKKHFSYDSFMTTFTSISDQHSEYYESQASTLNKIFDLLDANEDKKVTLKELINFKKAPINVLMSFHQLYIYNLDLVKTFQESLEQFAGHTMNNGPSSDQTAAISHGEL